MARCINGKKIGVKVGGQVAVAKLGSFFKPIGAEQSLHLYVRNDLDS